MKLKKILALGLSVIMIGELALVNASAIEPDTYEDEISFIQSKGFYLGDITNVEKIQNGIKVEANYLQTDEASYITYEEKSDGVIIRIEEGNVVDEFLFKGEDEVYIDGKKIEMAELEIESSFNNPFAMYYGGYASSFSANHPANVYGPYKFSGTMQGHILLDQTISFITVAGLSYHLGKALPDKFAPQLGSALLSALASNFKSLAVQYNPNMRLVPYERTVYKNSSYGPLAYYYIHRIEYMYKGEDNVFVNVYETEHLI